jgi:hypothetical protein
MRCQWGGGREGGGLEGELLTRAIEEHREECTVVFALIFTEPTSECVTQGNDLTIGPPELVQQFRL